MDLTYNGSYGGLLHPEVENTGFGLPDLSGVGMPDRGVSLLGTFDRNYMEQIARDNAWRLAAANEPQHWADGKSLLQLMQRR